MSQDPLTWKITSFDDSFQWMMEIHFLSAAPTLK